MPIARRSKRFFTGLGQVIRGMVHLTPREAQVAIGLGALLVDVREDHEALMKKFDVMGVVSMPHDTFKETYRQLPADQPLILADGVGVRSERDVSFLLRHGYRDVANLVGGLLGWESDGLPTVVDPAELWIGGCACKLRPRKTSPGLVEGRPARRRRVV